MQSRLPSQSIVLVGAGHTHLHIVRMWKMSPIPDTSLTLISSGNLAPYSGMLPGALAGDYESAEMSVDLHRLTTAASVRLICEPATGIDPEQRLVEFEGRPPLPYDVVSIGVGSVPAIPTAARNIAGCLSIKPMISFVQRLDSALNSVRVRNDEKAVSIAVIGAGAAGFEVSCCLKRFLERRSIPAELNLIDGAPALLPGYLPRTQKLGRKELDRLGIGLHLGRRIMAAEDSLTFEGGSRLRANLVIWAVSAAAPPLLEQIHLPKTTDGFLAVRRTLQSTGDERVFAVGDSATLIDNPFPKAGVYAVREGPILWENLKRCIENRPLVEYRPQRSFLSLLSTGDRRAIMQYKGFSAHAGWAWKWKDRIDRRFMAKFNDMTAAAMPDSAVTNPTGMNLTGTEMRCFGCGSKVAPQVLAGTIARLRKSAQSEVVAPLASLDDASPLRLESGQSGLLTVDFFPPPLPDPYLSGRITALHAMSDLWAMGATPRGAAAIAALPPGTPERQQEFLYEALAGACHEFETAKVTLDGGHTTEAPEAIFGFAVYGEASQAGTWRKSGLSAGDVLILTRPIGTGAVLAGYRRGMTKGPDVDVVIQHLLESNREGMLVGRDHGVRAATDVTGFGLAGHLLEMLRGSRVSARLSLSAIPLLSGFSYMVEKKVASSLAPANQRHEEEMRMTDPVLRTRPEWQGLFDPQTNGPLLLAIAEEKADSLVAGLRAIGFANAAVIGRAEQAAETPQLTVTG